MSRKSPCEGCDYKYNPFDRLEKCSYCPIADTGDENIDSTDEDITNDIIEYVELIPLEGDNDDETFN